MSAITRTIERYSSDKLWREELKYDGDFLIRYSLGKRNKPDGIVWNMFIVWSLSTKSRYLIDALEMHENWTEE